MTSVPGAHPLLVIPKMHIASVAEVSEDNAAVVPHIFAVISKVTKELGLESYRVVSNILASRRARVSRTCISMCRPAGT